MLRYTHTYILTLTSILLEQFFFFDYLIKPKNHYYEVDLLHSLVFCIALVLTEYFSIALSVWVGQVRGMASHSLGQEQ